MAIVLTSTTESQQNMDHAVSDKWEDPSAIKEFKSKAEPVPETEPETEPIEVPEPEAEPEVPAEEPETETETAEAKPKGHKGGGLEKRIAKLTAINAQQAKELDEYRAQANQKQTPPSQGLKKPEWTEYQAAGKSIDDFLEDRDKYKEDEKNRIAEEQRKKAIEDAYTKRASEALGKYDDWNEMVANSDIEIPAPVINAIKKMQNGPDVAYYLAKHPEEAQAMMEMEYFEDTIVAAYDISRKLAVGKEKPAPAPAKAKVQPPEPITPVTSSGTKAIKNWWEMSPAESVKFLNKRDNDKRMGKI